MIDKLKIIIDKIFKDKKKLRILLILCILIILVIGGIILLTRNRVSDSDKNTTTYDEIKSMIDNKDTFLIYYYNSKSKNKYNKEIKKYLDELGIRYFNYNDALINKEEYNNFIKLLNIDKEVFGIPSLIYINNGMVYANIINIDNKDIVDKFINNYDLYIVK